LSSAHSAPLQQGIGQDLRREKWRKRIKVVNEPR
jgi:hypothetical protein